jgi:hypothetical protein
MHTCTYAHCVLSVSSASCPHSLLRSSRPWRDGWMTGRMKCTRELAPPDRFCQASRALSDPHYCSTLATSTPVCLIINYLWGFHFNEWYFFQIFHQILYFPSEKVFLKISTFPRIILLLIWTGSGTMSMISCFGKQLSHSFWIVRGNIPQWVWVNLF